MISKFSNRFGPGLLFAATAVGVSHLVQTTRASADYGLTVVPLILLICLIKYPAFRAGVEYAGATGHTLVDGYAAKGRWILLLFFAVFLVDGITAASGVSLVTAGMMNNQFNLQLHDLTASMLIVILVTLVLAVGRYRGLEFIVKVFVVLFSIFSLLTAVLAGFKLGDHSTTLATTIELNRNNFLFLVALAGWMPIGLSASVMVSAWVVAKGKSEDREVSADEARFDFNLGYLMCFVLAVCFAVIGTSVLFQSGNELPQSATGFAEVIISLFTDTIGKWSGPLISIAALTVMFSTVIGVLDGFPRVYSNILVRIGKSTSPADVDRYYVIFLMLQVIAVFIILRYLMRSFGQFIDLATAAGFFAAPVIAFLNHYMIFSGDIPAEKQLGTGFRIFSLVCAWIITAISLGFIYFTIV